MENNLNEFWEGALCDKHFRLCSRPLRALINLYQTPHFLILREMHKVLVNLYRTFHIPFSLENLTDMGMEKLTLKASQSFRGDESKNIIGSCLRLGGIKYIIMKIYSIITLVGKQSPTMPEIGRMTPSFMFQTLRQKDFPLMPVPNLFQTRCLYPITTKLKLKFYIGSPWILSFCIFLVYFPCTRASTFCFLIESYYLYVWY